jgi:hypothetical protein
MSVAVSAQSGRVVPTPTPTPTPTPEVKFVVDPNADQYIVVFPSSFDGVFRKGQISYRGDEYSRALPSIMNSLIEHVNLAGRNGYRMIATGGFLPFAVLKLDTRQYEYGWFVSPFGRFDWAYAPQAKQGLRLIDHFLADSNCDSDGDCSLSFLSLLEREKGTVHPTEHFIVTRGRKQSDTEMLAQINQKIAEGFYPARLIDDSSIFFEKPQERDQRWNDRPDVKILRWAWHAEKKVNESAKEGYRLALLGQSFALMYRPRQPAPRVSYLWVDARKKSFPQTLAELQGSGAHYLTTYPDNWGFRTNLIFQRPVIDDGQRHEYRMLKFVAKMEPDSTLANRVQASLPPDSTAAVKTLNQLTKEGFTVRDFFFAERLSLLLERTH